MPAPDVDADLVRAPAERPSPRARLLWGAHAVLRWGVPVLGQLVWVLLDDGHAAGLRQVLLGASVLLGLLELAVVPAARWRVHRWEVRDHAVCTRSGWWTRETRVAPVARVQTVDTRQGPLQRVLGLADVTVTTASSAGPVVIYAIERGRAEGVAAELTRVAHRAGGDAT